MTLGNHVDEIAVTEMSIVYLHVWMSVYIYYRILYVKTTLFDVPTFVKEWTRDLIDSKIKPLQQFNTSEVYA